MPVVDPQAQALLDMLAQMEAPPLDELDPEAAREAFAGLIALAGPPPEAVTTEDRSLPGPGGDIPVRIYRPGGDAPLPLVVFFHGGGWVIGDLESHDITCRRLADQSGSMVMAVHYRRAPECRFPGAADDCFAATVWAHEHAAEIGADADRIAVCGDSAGGNLAAVTALRARDAGGPPLRFQALIYPVTDCAMDTESYLVNAEGYLLTAASMRWFWGHYMGEGDPAHPHASPLREPDLSGLPPALVITAEFDPLRDEGEAYAARLEEAGIEVTAHRYEGMIHGFFGLDAMLDQSKAAIAEVAEALRKALT